jgi:hypothetical protein
MSAASRVNPTCGVKPGNDERACAREHAAPLLPQASVQMIE